ncbi:MAG: lipid-A-disaccharide synthase [Bacteroidales bacterium]
MKFYIIAGEASGDLHASNLMKELRKQDVSSTFRCWGGDLMSDQGGQIVKHYRDLAFMGFVEVLANLKTIMGNLRFCKQDILAYQPDAVILVDYPGFNLRIAEFAKKAGFKVFYYISPQIWAWKKSRVYKIKKYVDKMFVILPFEKEFYARYDYKVDFVGHPLLDMINQLPESDRKSFREKNGLNTKPIIALLPGSRKQEIKKMLAGMLSVVKDFPEYQFVIAGAPSQEITFYKELMGNAEVNLVEGQTYSLLQNSHAALVTSGTATLETALFQIPEVVCYKSSAISYWIARMVIDKSIIKFISLVNLIMDKEVVLELIQGDFTSKRIKKELSLLTSDTNYRNKIFNDYQELVEKLGGSGASQKTASGILNALKD